MLSEVEAAALVMEGAAQEVAEVAQIISQQAVNARASPEA
jgi:hypothetical protein